MPAEIDTGGPRVLHCDYRADCPIPIVVPASTESFLDHEDRTVPLLPASIGQPVQRIDGNKSLVNECTAESRFLSRRRRGCGGGVAVVAEGGRIGERNVASRYSESTGFVSAFRRVGSYELRDALNVPNDGNAVRKFHTEEDSTREVSHPERLEFRDIAQRLDGRSPGTTRENRPIVRPREKIEDSSTSDHECSEEDGPCSSNAGLPDRTWGLFDTTATTRLIIGKSTFSSHRTRGTSNDRSENPISIAVSSTTDETCREIGPTNSWNREHETVDSNDRRESSRFDGPSRKNSDTTKKRNRACTKAHSYFQSAFLLFLVAFGQSGLLKSSVLNCSAKATTTGLSVLAIGTVIGAVSAAPVDLMGDAGVRAERSANLSHITGASRKIQMYIKNRHLQILPDGTVNGSNDDTSDYTIFQRTSVSRGQLRIQGVATCLYLCMDSCGLLYGSREYTEDCVFNETLEQHNYNTYSSVRWSTAKKTLYLGLNRRGQPRRVQAKGHNLGRLSAYARVLTQVAPPDRVEALQRRMLGAHHNVRHRHNNHGQHHHRTDAIQQSLCPTLPAQEKDGRDRFRCRKRKKRKKRKRRCRAGEMPGPQCQISEEEEVERSSTISEPRNDDVPPNVTTPESKRSCEGAASEEACRREALTVPSKKRKLRVEETTMTSSAPNGRNVTSNGKNKPPASNAKKVNVAGSMSQSKKPNLTDGKKRKRKGSPVRRKPVLPLARKRFAPGRADSTSAVPTAATPPIFAMSSSSWWSPGASTAPSGRGVSLRRRSKTAFNSSAEPLDGTSGRIAGPRRVGKAFAKNRAKSAIAGRPAVRQTITTTVVPDQTDRSLSTVKVPEAVSVRSPWSSTLASLEFSETTEDDSRSLSDSSSLDEDVSSTVSSERATGTLDSTVITSIEVTTAPTIFRLTEEENRSLEDDDADESTGSFDTSETIQSTTPWFPLERLAM